MRLGLIVRVDNRGLGVQTWELYRHLRPDVTVAVQNRHPGHLRGTEYLDRFPDAMVVQLTARGLVPYDDIVETLAGCDVVLTVETPYDFRLLADLKIRGTRTAVVGNREFLTWLDAPDLPHPDLFIAPSPWRLDDWPKNTVLLPHPVDRERLPFTLRTQAVNFLHLSATAMHDRAGTKLVVDAARVMKSRVRIRLKGQWRSSQLVRSSQRARSLVTEVHDHANYWDIYQNADVLLAPRRYGGQSLPVNEALSLGMPVVALDREPERSMLPPETLIPAQRGRDLRTLGGDIDVWRADFHDLAQKIDELATNPDMVQRLSLDADARAAKISWDALGPRWQKTLAELAA